MVLLVGKLVVEKIKFRQGTHRIEVNHLRNTGRMCNCIQDYT
jgi:hypothetical protein